MTKNVIDWDVESFDYSRSFRLLTAEAARTRFNFEWNLKGLPAYPIMIMLATETALTEALEQALDDHGLLAENKMALPLHRPDGSVFGWMPRNIKRNSIDVVPAPPRALYKRYRNTVEIS